MVLGAATVVITVFLAATVSSKDTPFIAFAIGFCAISIGVQQIYIYSTSIFQAPEKNLYLWSALTLFALGSGAVAAATANIPALTNNIVQQFVLLSVFHSLWALGMLFLFRLSATFYLFEHREYISKGKFRCFESGKAPWVLVVLEILHGFLMIGVISATIYGLSDQSNFSSIPQPILNIEYLPRSSIGVLALGIFFLLTFVSINSFMLYAYYKLIREGYMIEGILFFQPVLLIFFLPQLAQEAAFYFGRSVGPILVYFFILCCWLLVILLSWNDNPKRVEHIETVNRRVGLVKELKKAVSIALLVSLICLVPAALNIDSLNIMPYALLCLSYLTLGCAYLPVNALELASKESTKDADPRQSDGREQPPLDH